MQTQGIVEVRHGNGLFVRGFNLDAVLHLPSHLLMHDPSRVPEFLQIRQWLELAALDGIPEAMSEDTIREVESVITQWEACLRQGDAWRQRHREFHRLPNWVARNDSLVALTDIFWLLYNGSRFMENIPDVDPSVHLANHREILEAVRTRDVAAARRQLMDGFLPIQEQMRRWGGLNPPQPFRGDRLDRR